MSPMTAPPVTSTRTRYPHSCDHGFCTVCGGVWPCARAVGEPAPLAIPVPRLAVPVVQG